MSWPSAPPAGDDSGQLPLCSTEPNDVARDFFRNAVSLSIVCFASWKIAAFAQRLSLPRGSGFLLTGMLAGTFIDTIRNRDGDQRHPMIKGLECKYEILVNSNKCQPGSGEFFMSFPVRAAQPSEAESEGTAPATCAPLAEAQPPMLTPLSAHC